MAKRVKNVHPCPALGSNVLVSTQYEGITDPNWTTYLDGMMATRESQVYIMRTWEVDANGRLWHSDTKDVLEVRKVDGAWRVTIFGEDCGEFESKGDAKDEAMKLVGLR